MKAFKRTIGVRYLQIVDRHDGVGEQVAGYSEDPGRLLPELRIWANEFRLENDVEVIEAALGGEVIAPNRPRKKGRITPKKGEEEE